MLLNLMHSYFKTQDQVQPMRMLPIILNGNHMYTSVGKTLKGQIISWCKLMCGFHTETKPVYTS